MPEYKWAVIFFIIFFTLNTTDYSQTPTPKPSPPPTDTPEIVTTEEIKLNILAFDVGNNFVRNLRREDVVINEDGRLHQATSLRRIPANVLLVLDVGGEITYAKRNRQTAEAARRLVNALEAEDSVAALEYGDRVNMLLDWTKDKAQASLVLTERKLGFGRRSAFIYAVNKAVEFFDRAPLENRHLVLITDGVDSFNDSTAKEAVTKKLLSSDINVHVISYTRLQESAVDVPKTFTMSKPRTTDLPPGARPPGSDQASRKDENQKFPLPTINLDREMIRRRKSEVSMLKKSETYLTTITEDTNGEIFLPETTEEMIEKTSTLAKNIDSQYVVTYTPTRPLKEANDNEVRLIEVTSRRDGVSVQGHRKFVVSNNR